MEKENEFNTSQPGGMPFDPIVVLRDVLRRWLWIVLAALMVGTGSYIAMDMSYQPVYSTGATFVVSSRGSSATVYSHLSSTSSVAVVFEDLLNSSLLRGKILTRIDQTSFDGTISAAVIPETNLLTVTVTASDPRTAYLVTEAIIDHHEEVTYQVVDDVVLEVLRTPSVPTAPTNSAVSTSQIRKIMLIAAVAAAAGFAVLSYMSNMVRSGKEAKAKLDCNFLGEIPHEQKYKTLISRIRRRKTSILITNPVTGFGFAEAIRKLRRRVERYMKDRKVLMVTSLLENEGKSTVAMNLALAMTRKHKKVLLIDCDLRKPACYKLLGQNEFTHCLRDALMGKVQFADALIQDKKSGLYLLLERHGNRDSGDLVSGTAMQELIRWARSEFDCVVLDLPPMAEVSDAECVVDYADASLLVVRQNAAPAPVLNRAIASLERGNAKLLGCVLNNVYTSRLSASAGYDGYGQYSHYGKYGHYSYGKTESDT